MNSDSPGHAGSLRGSVIRGSAWMVAMRWIMRGIGLVNTMALVRLLSPADFGLVSMSVLFISLLDVLTGLGVEAALIQRREITREYSDTAWTLRLLQSLVVATLVFGAAPIASDYFREPRVTMLMRVLCISIVLVGFENIGVVAFRKELRFGTEFRFRVISKTVGVVATVMLAIWLRTYWALAWGIILTRFSEVVLSYVMHPYRPSLSLAKVWDLWSFSQWMLLRNMGMYVRRQVDGFVVGRYFSTPQMGVYSVSKELAEMPTTEVVWPMARVLYPSYAKLSHDPRRMERAYLSALSAIALFVIPAAVGLALLAEPVIRVILGERWIVAVPVLRWLALYNGLLTLAATVQNPLMAMGRMRRLTVLVWSQTLVVIPVVLAAARWSDLVLIAKAQVVAALALWPVFAYALTSASSIRIGEILSILWRPILSTGVMASVVFMVGNSWSDSMVFVLAVNAALGASVFIAVDLSLWLSAGRPQAAEKLAIHSIVLRFPNLFKSFWNKR